MISSKKEMRTVANYQLPAVFPYEGFVLPAVQRHFEVLGFRVEIKGNEDLACIHPETGERWCVEAKGETSARPTDFQTGLGQILQRMLDPAQHYALAVPNTPPFRRLCHSITRLASTWGTHSGRNVGR
ncbi:MAG: hypothetical protein ACR2JY_09300 [Chloroflexota bacterium]